VRCLQRWNSHREDEEQQRIERVEIATKFNLLGSQAAEENHAPEPQAIPPAALHEAGEQNAGSIQASVRAEVRNL